MNVLERIEKAKRSLERAEQEYKNGEKRLALGSLDFVEDRIIASRYLILAEIEDEEN